MGPVFLGAFSGLFSSHIGAIHCQALLLARHSLGSDVKIQLPTRGSGRHSNE